MRIRYCVNYGAGDKLVFGSGTRLIVEPNRHETPTPSVYYLRPSPPNAGDVPVSAACLAADYFPNNYSLELSVGSDSQQRNPKDSHLSIEDRSYSLLAFLTAPWSSVKNEMKCLLNNTNYSDDDIQAGCVEFDNDTDEKEVRELSLTVFGLRILFFKSVIFNILMTARAWI
ncbi:T cell receptor alpha chain MC.7.G5-like isoform X5 [Mobula hypostoma]|uniref:T cell receptor alpha chain MC.7.G5-like isoform X5 n=1 Tax=Mobula hypostoma TaxID=723540 RepID=UPI002FC2B2BB